MFLLRNSLQSIRRQVCRSNGIRHAGRPAASYDFPSNGAGRRRRLSVSIKRGREQATLSQKADLERFNSNVLNPQTVPLGTMSNVQWEDLFSAMDGWIYIGGYHAVNSAEKLVQRASLEFVVSSPILVHYEQRQQSLLDRHRALLQAWLVVCSEQRRSKLALRKAENAFHQLVQFSDHETPPIYELTAILDGWLEFDTPETAAHAASILLGFTSDLVQTQMAESAPLLTPYFGKTLTQLLSKMDASEDVTDGVISIGLEMADRMKMLSQQPAWSELQMPEACRKVMAEVSLVEPKIASHDRETKISSFEMKTLQQRIMDFVELATKDDQRALELHLLKLRDTEPSEELAKALVEFYVRVDNPDNAAVWMQRLSKESLLPVVLHGDILNQVMQSWLSSSDKRAPWKADETFRQLIDIICSKDAQQKSIGVAYFNSMFKIWTNSKDPAAWRKIQELHSRMKDIGVHADTESLPLLLTAYVKTQNVDATKQLLKQIFEEWGTFSEHEKVALAEAVVKTVAAVNVPSIAVRILHRLKDENLKPSEATHQSVQAILLSGSISPANVVRLVDVSTGLDAHTDLLLHRTAIQALMKSEKNSEKAMATIFTQGLDIIWSNKDEINPEHSAEFLSGVMAMLTSRKMYDSASNYLIQAETMLLEQEEAPITRSMIPLYCYRRVMARKWYQDSNVTQVEDTFNRLLRLYKSGYTNLRPDGEILGSVIKAKASATNVAGDLDNLIDTVLAEVGSENGDMPSLGADVYNTLLLAYRRQPDSSTIAEKSVALFKRMVDLGTDPDTKTINFVMQNVIKGGGQNSHRDVVALFDEFQQFSVEPDSFSYHAIIEACAIAGKVDHEESVRKCLETLAILRQQDMVTVATYPLVTKVLTRLTSKGSMTEKVALKVFQACCDDGMLSPSVRDHLQMMMSQSSWEQVYESSYQTSGSGWGRNIPKDMSEDDDAA